jgi:hypothetical protein
MKLTDFTYQGETYTVQFVETIQVAEGVSCDTYTFAGDSTRDLAIVTVEKGCKTPRQRVLLGMATVEGYISGEGVLTVETPDKATQTYSFPSAGNAAVPVQIGQIMQWTAGDAGLVFYELCEPPYADGRYENLA